MSCGSVSNHDWASSLRLEPEGAKATFSSEATAAGFLLIELGPPRPAVRGRLSLYIDGAVERALEARGAPSPTVGADRDRDGSLGDQVHRARVSGATGIALWFSPLQGIASASGVLDSDDSDCLCWWIRNATDGSVAIGFDPANRQLGVLLAPRTLDSLLVEAARTGSLEEDAEDATTAYAAKDPEALPHDVDGDDHDGGDVENAHANDDAEVPADSSGGFAESARAMAADLGDDGATGWLRDALLDLSTPPPRAVTERADGPAALHEPTRGGVVPQSIPRAPMAPRLDLAFAEPALAPARPAPAIDAEHRRKLEVCARELSAANGPKPLAVVERLFSTAYMPLRAALDRGADLPGLHAVADEWARSFEKSYTEGFEALRVRTKRPPMVVDVPDIALRVARLHGARSTQLLLVDAMRFDVADAVNDRLRALVGQRAACAERFLLWAALPTTTGTQVELIGRGPAGLREIGEGVSEDLVVARGRKASMLRRLKTGHRDVLKLDVVAARITEAGGGEPTGFDALADEVAARIASHFEDLQPRTLVMVFGDHGFQVASRGDGPAGARQGGASPEEVLVPAFAWLVGSVH
jgi:hypothetical protein